MKTGLIIPSTNTTALKELTELLPDIELQTAPVHLVNVTKEELSNLNDSVVREALTLSNSDMIVSVCLVATMLSAGGHTSVESDILKATNCSAVTSSAGALIRYLHSNNYRKVVMVAPYSDELTLDVIRYFNKYNITVIDYINFNIIDNDKVAKIPTIKIIDAVHSLNLTDAQAIIVSACVQMPSLEALRTIESEIPLVSAMQATAYEIDKYFKSI